MTSGSDFTDINGVGYDIDIIKSVNDRRSYRYIELKNQLKCVLIHDPKADKSAACLDVKVGTALDPDG